MYPTTIKLMWNGITATMFTVFFASAVWADESGVPIAFYQQIYPTTNTGNDQQSDNLLRLVSHSDSHLTSMPLTRRQSDNLAFNYLWLQQYRDDYRHTDGGAALGRMLRMGLKTLYRNYYGGGSIRAGSGDNDIAADYSGLGYNLRVNDDNVQLGIEYQF